MKLCKFAKKHLDKKFDEYLNYEKDPKYICRKCGRESKYDKKLCKPVEL